MLRLCTYKPLLFRLCGARCVSVQAATGSRAEEIKPFSAIPGPKPLPVIGNLLDIRRNAPSMRLYVQKCIKEYGGIFKLTYPGGGFVYFADPHILEDVLRAEGKYPSRFRDFEDKLAWFFTHLGYKISIGVLNDEGWKELRTAIGKQSLPRNVNSYIPGMNEILQRFTCYLRTNRDERGYVKDISELLNQLLMELSAKFVYNKDLRVIDSGDKDVLAFINAVKTSFTCMYKVGFEPPLYKIFPTKLYREMSGALKEVRGFGMKIAEEVQAKKPEGDDVMGLLEQWLAEGKLSKEQAVMVSIDMFGAGVDTTANTATFMLHAIATNPEVEEQLHAEISSVLGDSRLPTAENLAAMPYVKGIVKETLRFYPTSTGVPRTLKDDMVLMGYHVPAKSNIYYSTYASGRDEQLYKDAEKFDPDRWGSSDINAFAQLPFGFGPRSCYGRRFAELELRLFLIEMARHFLFRTDQKELPLIESAILRPDGEIPLKLIERQ